MKYPVPFSVHNTYREKIRHLTYLCLYHNHPLINFHDYVEQQEWDDQQESVWICYKPILSILNSKARDLQ